MCVQFYKFRSLEEKIALYNSVRQSDERVTLTSECQLAGNLTSYFPYDPGKSSILYFHMEFPCHSKQMLSATKTEQLILIVRIITLNFENSTHARTHTHKIQRVEGCTVSSCCRKWYILLPLLFKTGIEMDNTPLISVFFQIVGSRH